MLCSFYHQTGEDVWKVVGTGDGLMVGLDVLSGLF